MKNSIERNNPAYIAAFEYAQEHAGLEAALFADYQATIIARVIKAYGVDPKQILDYGCGEGTTTYLMHQHFKNAHIDGVDAASNCIKTAKGWYSTPTLHFSITRSIHSERNQKFASKNYYNVIYVSNMLHHVPKHEHKALIAKLNTLLAPGGLLIILEFNPWNVLQTWRFYTDKEEKGNSMLWPRYTRKLLKPFGKANTIFIRKNHFYKYIPFGCMYTVTVQKFR